MSEFRKPSDWFSYEGRCFVCGRKYERAWGNPISEHLRLHVVDGYLEHNQTLGGYRQVKPHEVGFPGINVELPFWVMGK